VGELQWGLALGLETKFFFFLGGGGGGGTSPVFALLREIAGDKIFLREICKKFPPTVYLQKNKM